jgi:tetratricopeptide (TPR) repeat protein
MLYRTFVTTLLLWAFLFSACSLWAQNSEAFDANRVGEELTLKELKQVLERYDFYDQVRTNHQKEDIVTWLLQQSIAKNFTEGELKCKNMLGVIYRDNAKYYESIALHDEVLERSGKDTVMAILSLNNLGVVYRRLDRPRIAIDYHYRALDMSGTLKSDNVISRRSICIALNSIGNINLALNNPNQAIYVFEQSLEMEYENKNDLGIAINLHNIGGAYERLGDYDLAMKYYRESLQVNDKIESGVGRSICYNSIGHLYFMENEVDKALDYFERSLNFAQAINDNYYIAQAVANLGRAYLKLKNFGRALEYFIEYQALAHQIHSAQMITESFQLLSEFYHLNGNDAYALELYMKGSQFADSLSAEQNAQYLDELQTLYEAKKQKQELELLKERAKINRLKNLLLIAGLILALFIITTVIFIQRKKGKFLQNELRQKLLRSQMNPHFIFNALGSIQNFMFKNEPQKAASFLGNFSSLTRSVLKNSTEEMIPLSEEIETLRNYIILEQMRFKGAFKFEIAYDEEVLEPEFILFPPMMLQPFVENAIIHGLKNKEDGHLKIEFECTHQILKITIEDNGCGILASKVQNDRPGHQSMAMIIFEQRRKLIQRKLKKTINFAVTDLSTLDGNQSGTRIEIMFPLIEQP